MIRQRLLTLGVGSPAGVVRTLGVSPRSLLRLCPIPAGAICALGRLHDLVRRRCALCRRRPRGRIVRRRLRVFCSQEHARLDAEARRVRARLRQWARGTRGGCC